MADQELSCSDCGDTFPFRETEQAFYRERNLTPPKRCRACRDKRKTASASGPGGPPGAGGGPRARFGGARAGGPPGRDRARPDARPGARADARPDARRGGPPGRDGAAPRGPYPAREGRPERSREDRPERPRTDATAKAAPTAKWGRPTPAFPRDGAAPAAAPPAEGGEARRPPRAGRVVDAAPQKRPARVEAPPRPPRDPKNPRDGGRRAAAEQTEKPKFTVTCQECGTQAEVPFKPIDGRQVFCQPCYRARKGTVTSATEGVAIDGNDAGIVE